MGCSTYFSGSGSRSRGIELIDPGLSVCSSSVSFSEARCGVCSSSTTSFSEAGFCNSLRLVEVAGEDIVLSSIGASLEFVVTSVSLLIFCPQCPQKRALARSSEPQYSQCCIWVPPGREQAALFHFNSN